MNERSDTSFWKSRPVLVTGAAGFIGSHLTEWLVRAGADVRAFVRYNSRNDYGWLEALEPAVFEALEVFRGDLANPEAVLGAAEGRDVVLHLGALIPIPYSYRHPREFVSANVEGTLNVLEAARRTSVARLVQVSTSEVYGTAVSTPISEEHPLNAQSPYAATKIAADQLALSFRAAFETPVVIARPFNTFGPRQSARAIIPTVITQALAGAKVEMGARHPTRDFLYVEDTVAGLVDCGRAPGVEGEVINLGSGKEISIGDLAELIASLSGQEVEFAQDDERLRPPASEVERLLADRTKATELLGWEPRVDLEEGLRTTIGWFREALDAYKPSLYNL
jgi:dTDP-glucose 4,6-dehydratase